jgi:gamma-glutamylcyclotransferase (GGCT)/AIG2-like uncharacterized protein YtfP
MMEQKHLVFVYGTLRSGHCNHHMLRDASPCGVGSTDAKYAMYLVSGYPYVTSSEILLVNCILLMIVYLSRWTKWKDIRAIMSVKRLLS